MTGQLALFVEAEPVAPEFTRRGSVGYGPRGLLKALIEQGLDEDALKAAAALVLQLDAEPIGEGE